MDLFMTLLVGILMGVGFGLIVLTVSAPGWPLGVKLFWTAVGLTIALGAFYSGYLYAGYWPWEAQV